MVKEVGRRTTKSINSEPLALVCTPGAPTVGLSAMSLALRHRRRVSTDKYNFNQFACLIVTTFCPFLQVITFSIEGKVVPKDHKSGRGDVLVKTTVLGLGKKIRTKETPERVAGVVDQTRLV